MTISRTARNAARSIIVNAIVGWLAPGGGVWRRVLRALLGG